MASQEQESGSSERWEKRYLEGKTGWDLGHAPAALVRHMESEPEHQRVLVPGAGRGHDAFAWAAAGHRVTAVDFAPSAVQAMKDQAQARDLALEVEAHDVRKLPQSWEGQFDLVWEQTCLCALRPEDRAAYLRSLARVLRPGGRLLALLWAHGREGGPPYNLPPDYVRSFLAENPLGVWEPGEPSWLDPQEAEREGEYLLQVLRGPGQS